MKAWRDSVNRLCQWIMGRMRRVKLTARLCVTGVAVGVIPLLVVAYFSYTAGSRAIQDKVERFTTQTIDQVTSVIGTRMQIIINDGVEIAYSDLVQDGLLRYDEMNAREKNQLQQSLQEYINRKFIFNSYNGEIMLYTLNHTPIAAYVPEVFRFNPKPAKLIQLLSQARELSGRPLWLTVDESFEQRIASQVERRRTSTVLTRAIKSLKTGSIIGYIMIRLDEGEISELYRSLDISQDSSLFVLNSNNTVVSSGQSGIAASKAFGDEKLLERVASSGGKPFAYQYEGKNYLVVCSAIQQSDWTMVALLPFKYLYADTQALLVRILVTGLICMSVSVLLFILLAGSIVQPIRMLQQGIDDFSRNPTSRHAPEIGGDEIAALTRQFNRMTEEIAGLIQDVRRRERQKHDLETKALQAQINPHFLANMLNTVVYMAQIKHEDNIAEMVRSIIDILTVCMKNDLTQNTVREAVQFLNSYKTIQEYRMLGRFKIQFEIAPEIEECFIPRFILQPLVENALIHGIEPTGRAGLIVIRGYRQGDELHFTVTDNGQGIPQDKIEAMLSEPDAQERRRMTGIGIANVQRRLQLMYGKRYGLHITSVENVFTTVEMVLPDTPPQAAGDARKELSDDSIDAG